MKTTLLTIALAVGSFAGQTAPAPKAATPDAATTKAPKVKKHSKHAKKAAPASTSTDPAASPAAKK